jgi:hypothetical protein
MAALVMIAAIGSAAMAQAADRGIGLVEKAPQVQQIQMGPFWALLIGIDDYDHWPKLATPVNDTKALENTLVTRYGFVPERVKRLTNREATREGILEGLEWLINGAGEHDNVVIYYAGHGEEDKVTGYWVPVEAKRDKKGAYISNSTIRDYVGTIRAKHVYLVADSCFSGSLFAGATRSKPPTITGRYYQEVYNRLSRQGLTSGGTEPVADNGYDGHSVFAYYLLKSLRENNEPYLTASALFDRIAVPVANNSKQTPISRPIRDVRDEGGEFLFALAVATTGLSDAGMGPGEMGETSGVPPQQGGSMVGSSDNKNIIIGSLKPMTPLRTIVLVSEKDRGVLRDDSIVGNALSEKLSERGVPVVSSATLGKKRLDHLKQAVDQGEGIASVKNDLKGTVDAIAWGSVATRPGHTGVDGLVACVADASIQVISVESGEMIAQRNLTNVRGFGANQERACLVALQNMAGEMGAAVIERWEQGR